MAHERHETSRSLDTSGRRVVTLPHRLTHTPRAANRSVNQGGAGRRTGVWRLPDRCPPGFPRRNSIIPWTTTTSNSPTLSLSVPAASDARQPSCLLPTFSFTHGDRRALKRRADHAKWRHLSYKLRRKPTPSSRGCSRAIPGQIADAFHSVERQGVSQPAGHAVMSRSSSLYRTISLQFHVRLRPAERVTAVRAW